MRLKTTLCPTIFFGIVAFINGQDVTVPASQAAPGSPFNYDPNLNPTSSPAPNLDVNPYNAFSTQEPRYGSFDQNAPINPYGQNDPYNRQDQYGNRQDPYGPVGKDDPYGRGNTPYGSDPFQNRGTPWRNNVYGGGGGRNQFDAHSSVIKEA